MDAEDTGTLFLADRAAEWLLRLESVSPQEHAEFRSWLVESPLHVREALAATAVHLLLIHLFSHGKVDPLAFVTQLGNVTELTNDMASPATPHATRVR